MPDCNKNIDEGKVSNERIHGARNVNALMTVTCSLRWASLGKLQTRNCTMKGLYSTASTVDEWQRAIAPALVIVLRHRLLPPQIAVEGTATAASPGSAQPWQAPKRSAPQPPQSGAGPQLQPPAAAAHQDAAFCRLAVARELWTAQSPQPNPRHPASREPATAFQLLHCALTGCRRTFAQRGWAKRRKTEDTSG